MPGVLMPGQVLFNTEFDYELEISEVTSFTFVLLSTQHLFSYYF